MFTILCIGLGILILSHVQFGMAFSASVLTYMWFFYNNINVKILVMIYLLYCAKCIYDILKKNGYLYYFTSYDRDSMKQEIKLIKTNQNYDILFREKLAGLKTTDLGLYNAYLEMLK